MNKLTLAFVLAFSASLAAPRAQEQTPTSRPNVVLIMADDMGYSDIGCYGSEIKTPVLDQLAESGLRLTQFYNTSRCCPTRAALLTGLYSHQAGIGLMTGDRGYDAYRGDLNRQCVTLAEALDSEYQNYMSGKWHVTRHVNPQGPNFNWPLQRGFDRFYGTIIGAGSFYDPATLCRGNQFITPENDPEYQVNNFYYTDAINDNAIQFLKDHEASSKDSPFFMYVSYTSAHWPMHALPRDIAKYDGKYDKGYTPAYQARLEKMKQLGLIDPKWEIPGPVGDWSKVELKEWESACMEVYAAMVDNMDQGIGRIVKCLEEHKQLENTLIFYLQDNGGCAEGFGRGKLVGPLKRPAKPTLKPMGKNELQTNMIPTQSRDGYPLRRGKGVMPGPPETEIGYGENWANVSNTPFREYKHWVHEGGIATPLIAHWPAGIAAKDALKHEVTHLIDVMATAIDIGQASYPEQRGDTKTLPPEGISLRTIFKDQPGNKQRAVFFEHEGNRAVREGKWKLVANGPRGSWQLHDMEADRVEATNVAEQFPTITARLKAAWEAWATRCNVVPWPYRQPYDSNR